MNSPDPESEIAQPETVTPKPGKKWLKRLIVLLLMLALLVGGSLWLLATTGWVLDPVLKPLISFGVSSEQQLQPKLQHLRIRLHPREGLDVTAQGFSLWEGQHNCMVNLGKLAIHWNVEQLKEQHWMPQSVTWTGIRVLHLPTTAPKDESEPAPADSLTINWQEIQQTLLTIMPTENRETVIAVNDFEIQLVQHPDLPRFLISTSTTTLNRSQTALNLSHRTEAWIDTHSATFASTLQFDPINRTLNGRVSAQEVDVGWSGKAAKVFGLNAGLSGFINGWVTWDMNLDPIKPKKVEYAIEASALNVDLPDQLRAPLIIDPWSVQVNFDFITGTGSMSPVAISAGPVKWEAMLSTHIVDGTADQRIAFSGKLSPFVVKDLSLLLKPGLVPTLEEWVDETGGWTFNGYTMDGWVDLGLQDDPASPLVKEARVTFESAVLAGTETLALSGQVHWKANPFLLNFHWTVPPFSPAGLPVPHEFADLVGTLDIPLSAHGGVVMSSFTSLEKTEFNFRAEAGRIIPLGPLQSYLNRPVNVDGIEMRLLITNALQDIRLESLRVAWEEIEIGAQGSMRLDKRFKAGQMHKWTIEGAVNGNGLMLDNLLGALSDDMKAFNPIATEQLPAWGMENFRLTCASTGELSGELKPSAIEASGTASTVFRANNAVIPLKLNLQAQQQADDFIINTDLGLGSFVLGDLLKAWPVGLMEDLRLQMLAFHPNANVSAIDIATSTEFNPIVPEESFLRSLEINCAFDEISARLPELGALAIKSIHLKAMISGLFGMTSMVANAMNVDVVIDTFKFGYGGWVTAGVDHIKIAGDESNCNLAIHNVVAGPLQVNSISVTAKNILSKMPTVAAEYLGSVDLAKIYPLIESAPASMFADDLDLYTGDLAGLIHFKGSAGGPLSLPLPTSNWIADFSCETAALKLPGIVPHLIVESPAFSLSAGLSQAMLSARLNVATTNLVYQDWTKGPASFDLTLWDSTPDLLQLKWAANGDKLTIVLPQAPNFKKLSQPANASGTVRVHNEQPQLTVDATVEGKFMMPFNLDCSLKKLNSPVPNHPLGGIEKIAIQDLSLGLSSFWGKITPAEGMQGIDVHLNGNTLYLDEWLSVIDPLIDDFLSMPPKADADMIQAVNDPENQSTTDALGPQSPAVNFSLELGRVQLTPGKILEQFVAEIRHSGNGLPDAFIHAHEGKSNEINVSIIQAAEKIHRIKVEIPDVAGLAMLCVAPLEGLKMAQTQLGQNLDVVRRVPDSFAGGTLNLEGNLNLVNQDELFIGSFSIVSMKMVKAPCLLRLVAGVSGKPFIEGVEFNEFSMERFRVGKSSFAVQNLKFDGPVSMNISEALYRMEDQFIFVSGDHYLTNFVLEGPITKPTVWLDNKFTRALGTDDSDWADW